jgi:hypothetical protein
MFSRTSPSGTRSGGRLAQVLVRLIVWSAALRRAEAVRLLDALRERSNRRYVSPLNVAIVFAGLQP